MSAKTNRRIRAAARDIVVNKAKNQSSVSRFRHLKRAYLKSHNMGMAIGQFTSKAKPAP